MRLIDADALHDYMRAMKKWVVKSDGKHNEGYTYDQVHFGIDAQPTVDAVPVIRCMECKHWYKGKNINYCRRFWDDDGEPKLYRCSADDFCSRAERREE